MTRKAKATGDFDSDKPFILFIVRDFDSQESPITRPISDAPRLIGGCVALQGRPADKGLGHDWAGRGRVVSPASSRFATVVVVVVKYRLNRIE